ncbi:MAG TPA: exodeoxyribonuclease V subunit gamma [Ideonella sp.]|uniref:exodeoxyribonuclease V subunit gamma n=1 Tax=Ideonella sp. TaxID=1929293 RepID=UPI002C69A75B|nr:exodeoxyribonuclease V subunit gamma [Ideonella sp.]HSI50864.1 exodeoxyribonuclease V subunit gamma [Ideonella sp.]
MNLTSSASAPASPIAPGLMVMHGNRAELLAETLFAWLRAHPLAPLEEEVMLVQSNGMAEWLKMTLAQSGGAAGICAAARVELPARFLWRLYRQVLGRDQVPLHSALDKTPLTWRLMQLLPELAQRPGFEPVAGFLLGDEQDRLLQLSRRLADLFDQYQVYRADWLEGWAQGHDVLRNPGRPDHPLPADQRWQAMLWRELLAPLAQTQHDAIRPRLHERVLARLAEAAQGELPLPRRIVLFGMTHVPLPTLQALAAMAPHSQVLLAVPNPCRFHWADILDGRELLQIERRRQPLREGRDLAALPLAQMHAHAHPLLAAWGRQGRDFVRQLDAFDEQQRGLEQAELPRLDLFDEDPAEHAPLLTRVQARIRDLVPLAEHDEAPLDPADQSIVFHSAHSAMRELEVLHDQLLTLLAQPASADRPALQPRDIVVMVPDIDAVAPAVRAVFGQYARQDARHIPFDIADLGARHASPLVGALEWLLRLPQQRCRFSELRDLLDVPALAARFGLDAESLPQLTHWMAGAGLRWGLHEAQRASLGLGACGAQNSGWWALRRMLLGYASGAAPLDVTQDFEGQAAPPAAFDGIEPYAEVGGLDAELAGGLAQLLGRLAHWWALLRTPATPAQWAERGRALLADLFRAGSDDERQTLAALDDALATWLDACAQAGFEAEVPLAVTREAWLDALDEPALNRRFRAGGVTFCTLMPMRAIPFEVVCLLGMNDGDYPRRAMRSDFDLMATPGQTRAGDRSRRDDDRQLMLEALLSARRMLYLSWAGRNARDNSEQPPSVLVSQLRDYLAAAWGQAAVDARSHEHPLQPFSRRYFEPGSPAHTWAREWRQAHAEAKPAALPDAAAPEQQGAPVALTLDLLTTFLRNPVKAFFRHRLQVVFDADEVEDADDEAFEIAGLDEHQLVDELLADSLAELQRTLESAPEAELAPVVTQRLARLRRAGRLPLAGFGERTEALLAHDLAAMLQAWQQAQRQFPQAAPRLPLHLAQAEDVLPLDGQPLLLPLQLDDWLDGLRVGEERPVWLQVQASRLCGKKPASGKATPRLDKLVGPWLRAMAAAASGQPVDLLLIGRDATLYFTPPAPESANVAAQALLAAWQVAQQQPLPVAPRTALAWLDAPATALATYQGDFQRRGEVDEPCLARLFPDFETLTQADAAGANFGHWAQALYAPLREWAQRHVSVTWHPSAEGVAEEAA